jgi:hypothetical protein
MGVTLRYEGGTEAHFSTLEEALVQAGHEEYLGLKRGVEVIEGAPGAEGQKLAGRAELSAATKAEPERLARHAALRAYEIRGGKDDALKSALKGG